MDALVEVKTPLIARARSRSRSPGANGATCFAYLNDPVAVHGPQTLFRQKAIIDHLAAEIGATITAYRIDSGRRSGDVVGVQLTALLTGRWRGTLLVAADDVFSTDLALARHIRAVFSKRGIRVLTATSAVAEMCGARS